MGPKLVIFSCVRVCVGGGKEEDRDLGPSTTISTRFCLFGLPHILRFWFSEAVIDNHWAEASVSLPPPLLPCPPLGVYTVSLHQSLCLSRFVALHTYSAHGPDELDLQKGESIRVLGKYQDGWLKGISLVTGRVGIFPNNYVIPVFRKTSSFADSRSPGLYAAWTLSTSSVSSQGSISEGDPRQSRAFKSVFVPTAIVNPVRTTASLGTFRQGSLRKGRSSMRKSKWWQRGTCLELSEGGPDPGGMECPLQKQGSWLENQAL